MISCICCHEKIPDMPQLFKAQMVDEVLHTMNMSRVKNKEVVHSCSMLHLLLYTLYTSSYIACSIVYGLQGVLLGVRNIF